MMNYLDLENIIPQIVLASSAIIVLIVLIIKPQHLLINRLTFVLLLLSAVSVFLVPDGRSDSWLLASGGFSSYINFIIILAAIVITLLSYPYFEKHDINREEYYILILLGTLGASTLAVSNHFITFLLGLELLSLSIYIMIAYLKIWENVIEAAVKYLILASVSSAFILMGMALLYAATGAMDFITLGSKMQEMPVLNNPLLTGGIGLIITGAGFKMALVPFHMWTPEVYQGAPLPTTMFIASISKAATAVVLLRFFMAAGGHESGSLLIGLSVIAILSMLFGNILALMQNNLKRLLAFSSIAHLGYILVSFIAGGKLGIEAVAFYLLVYMASILGAFGMIVLLSAEKTDVHKLSELRGMFWKSPGKALILTIMLLSLAGIPATAGFMGKFYILSAGIYEGHWLLAIVLVIASVIGLFYYLRIIVEMFKESESDYESSRKIKNKPLGAMVLVVLFIIVLGVGILPGYVAKVIQYLVENSVF